MLRSPDIAHFGLAFAFFALWGCAPVQAEVGSGFPPGRCDALAPLRLYYRNSHPADSSNLIDYIVKVENATGAPVPLTSLQVRYYLTNELAPPSTVQVFYADTCCPTKPFADTDILSSIQPMPAQPNADAYFEIEFPAALGSLEPGDAVQVELGFHDPAYARDLTQTNDYSYGAGASGTQMEWDACPGPQCDAKFTSCSLAVFRDDVLAWGTPP